MKIKIFKIILNNENKGYVFSKTKKIAKKRVLETHPDLEIQDCFFLFEIRRSDFLKDLLFSKGCKYVII